MNTDVLVDLGLSRMEAQIYVTALSLGPTTVLKLSRQTGLKRTSLYAPIQNLEQLGLLRRELVGIKSLLVAEEPRHLERLLHTRKLALDQVLPELNALYNAQGEQGVLQIYRGKGSIRSAYNKMLIGLKPGDPYCIISNIKPLYESDPKFFDDFFERRSKIGLDIRILISQQPGSEMWRSTQARYKWKLRYLQSGTQLKTNLVISPKRVLIHQTIGPHFVLMIENNSVISMHSELFELLWGSASVSP